MTPPSPGVQAATPLLYQFDLPKDPVSFALFFPYWLLMAVYSTAQNFITASCNQQIQQVTAQLNEVKKNNKPPARAGAPTMAHKQTSIIDKKNVVPPLGAYEILNVERKPGKVEEAVVKCTSGNFSVEIQIDNTPLVWRTWTEYSGFAGETEGISATHRGGEYSLSLSDLHFREKMKLILHGKGLTFPWIYAKVVYE